MANWGVNLDDSIKDLNPFLHQNSVVTTMYNYFGYSKFCQFITIWVDQGLLSEGWAKPHAPLLESFKYGIKENIVAHAQIEDLVKYSRFVKVRVNGHKINSFDVQISHFNSTLLLQFAIKVCAIFLSEFQEQKLLFPGVDGEAMFVGTVLYSPVHTFIFMDWNLKDPLYLDTSLEPSFRQQFLPIYSHKPYFGLP